VAAILKHRKSPYLSNDLTDRYEIGTVTHVDPLDRADRQSYEILKIQDGCGRLLKNRNNASFYTSLPLNTFYCT